MNVNTPLGTLASEVLSRAVIFLDKLEQENAVDIMTEFLRSASPSTQQINCINRIDSLVVCLACGGSAKRWANFLGIPKHLVDIGKDHPLLDHTKHQLLNRLTPEKIIAVVDKNHRQSYQNITGLELVDRVGDPEDDVALEILTNPETGLKQGKNLLLLMGDVAFSETAIDEISIMIKSDSRLRVFGRSKKNEQYKNTGGEIFGAYVPGREIENVRSVYDVCKKLYYGTAYSQMYRYSTWEVLSLITAAGKISGANTLDEIVKSSYSLREILPLMSSTFKDGQFLDSVWHEIDDETDDFDFPCEYLRWLAINIKKYL